MAWTAEQLSYAGYLAMNHEMRQNPEDLYNTERPLLKALQANKKPFPGAKQYIIEKLRTTNDQNFQWYAGSDAVTFNRRRTITQAQFAWGSAHDGFGLDEDELTQNYIVLTDDTKSSPPTTDEQKQFVDLIEENTRALKEGFAEKFDYELHRDGTQDTNAVAGLDLLARDLDAITDWPEDRLAGVAAPSGRAEPVGPLAQAAAAEAVQRYDWSVVADQIIRVYETVAGAGVKVQVVP